MSKTDTLNPGPTMRQNTGHMNIGLHAINGEASPAYHINFTPLGYNVDFDKLEAPLIPA